MSAASNRLASLLRMGEAELHSRANAWAQVQEAGRAVIAELEARAGEVTLKLTVETDEVQAVIERALQDAQVTGQALPLVRTVVLVPRTEDMANLVDATVAGGN